MMFNDARNYHLMVPIGKKQCQKRIYQHQLCSFPQQVCIALLALLV